MLRPSVIVADKAHAIFFALENGEKNNPNVESRLVERRTLQNVALGRLQGAEKQDTRRGDYSTAGPRNTPNSTGAHASVGGFAARSSMSDAENAEVRHALQLFAKEILGHAEKMVQKEKPDHLVVVAGPEMLGVLRSEMSGHFNQLRISEVRKDVASLKPHEIHDLLAKEDVLPARRSKENAGFGQNGGQLH